MRVNVQIAAEHDDVPGCADITQWAERALAMRTRAGEMTVRVVGLKEGRALNEKWRQGSGATNVLAFPIEGPDILHTLIGDVIVCAPVANAEASHDQRPRNAHWAHLVIHGTLHLLGFDHVNDDERAEMEQVERTLLNDLGYPDPYL